MENFEISDSLIGITKIWEAFFLPIVSAVIVFLFIYFLMGKQYIYHIYQKYKIIKIDNKYFRQKHIKIKKKYSVKRSKDKNIILIPLSERNEKIVTAFQNPVVFIIGILLLVYTIYKLMNLCSNLYPITFSFNGEAMLLYSTPKECVAEIWAYFPEYTLASLYHKISILGEECSYAKYADYSAIHVFGSISKFCSILCVINFFLHKPQFKTYIKTLFLLFSCLIAVVLSFYFQFQKNAKVLEQKAYYVEEQLVLDAPSVATDINAYRIAIGKVENELRYIDNSIFYDSFHINIVFLRRYLD
nr:hypothetical protein [uncultured Acetatifactor sp.]